MTELEKRISYKLKSSLNDIIKKRETLFWDSDRSTYGPSETMTFYLQLGQSFLDLQSAYLTFDLKCSDAAGDIEGSVGRLVNRIKVGTNSTSLQEVLECDRYEDILLKHSVPKDYLLSKGQMFGYASSYADSQTAAAVSFTLPNGQVVSLSGLNAASSVSSGEGKDFYTTNNYSFAIPIHHLAPFFSQDKLFPGVCLNNGPLSLQITLNSYTKAFKRSVVDLNSTFILSNVKIVGDVLHMSDSANNLIKTQMEQGGVSFSYDDVFYTSESSAAASTSLEIRKGVYNARYVVLVPTITSNSSSQTADSFESKEIISSYQFQVGSQLYPSRRVEKTPVKYLEVHKALNHLHNVNYGTASVAEYKTKAFCIGLELDTDSSDSVMSGIGLSQGNIIKCDFNVDTSASGTNGANYTTHAFMVHSKVAQFGSNGSVIVSE